MCQTNDFTVWHTSLSGYFLIMSDMPYGGEAPTASSIDPGLNLLSRSSHPLNLMEGSRGQGLNEKLGLIVIIAPPDIIFMSS